MSLPGCYRIFVGENTGVFSSKPVQKSRSVLLDGSRFLDWFRRKYFPLIAVFHSWLIKIFRAILGIEKYHFIDK